jgi:hypothetical protein
MRGRIDFRGNLRHPGEGMHHDKTLLDFRKERGIKPVGSGDPGVLREVSEPLLLDPGDIEHVGVLQGPPKIWLFPHPDPGFSQFPDNLVGHAEGGRGVQDQFAAKETERPRERVYRPAVPEVSHQDHPKTAERSEMLVDGGQIEKSLGRVLAELEVGSAMVMTRPPSLCIAVSKDNRVRVDGSKKAKASSRPWSASEALLPSATGIHRRAAVRISRISSRERSRMEIRSRPLKDIG